MRKIQPTTTIDKIIFSAILLVRKNKVDKMYTYGFYNLERDRMEREISAINKQLQWIDGRMNEIFRIQDWAITHNAQPINFAAQIVKYQFKHQKLLERRRKLYADHEYILTRSAENADAIQIAVAEELAYREMSMSR